MRPLCPTLASCFTIFRKNRRAHICQCAALMIHYHLQINAISSQNLNSASTLRQRQIDTNKKSSYELIIFSWLRLLILQEWKLGLSRVKSWKCVSVCVHVMWCCGASVQTGTALWTKCRLGIISVTKTGIHFTLRSWLQPVRFFCFWLPVRAPSCTLQANFTYSCWYSCRKNVSTQ